MVSGVAAAESTRISPKEARKARMESRVISGAIPGSSNIAVGEKKAAIESGFAERKAVT